MPKSAITKSKKQDAKILKKIFVSEEDGIKLRNCEECHKEKLDTFHAKKCIYCFFVKKLEVFNCEHIRKALLPPSECQSYNPSDMSEDEDENESDNETNDDDDSLKVKEKKKLFKIHLNTNTLIDKDSLFECYDGDDEMVGWEEYFEGGSLLSVCRKCLIAFDKYRLKQNKK
jgi:hypothetical protein